MKKLIYQLGEVLTVSIVFAFAASAQTGSASKTKFGKGQDSIDCVRSFSLYQQDFKNKDYNSAIVNWRKVFKDCPQSSVNNIPRGISMYQYFIAKELDATVKAALVDTLMQIYQFGINLRTQKQGEYLASMAQDMMKYLGNTPENQKKVLTVLEECIQVEKEKTPATIFNHYMNITLRLNGDGIFTDEELLEKYTKLSDLLTVAIKASKEASKEKEDLARLRDVIDDNFAKSPAANCENLVKIYGAKFENNQKDLEFLRKLTKLLNRNECTASKLFEQASERQFELEPSSAAAYNMAKLFYKKDNFNKALEYFDSAIEHETDPIDKASYYCQKAQILLTKFNKHTDAKKCVMEAAKLRPDWGEPYVLLANIYAAGPKCGEDDFEKTYVYWVIVDKLIKAKTVDPDYADRVNSSIKTYSQYFPKKEEAFFRSITEGNTMNVGCWINESTRARF
jgi:tetratricopeptide (TPR) repeat protein